MPNSRSSGSWLGEPAPRGLFYIAEEPPLPIARVRETGGTGMAELFVNGFEDAERRNRWDDPV
jgi:hypothetical protein